MHRIIFELGSLSITSWGVMVVVAFVVGIWIAEKRAVKYGIPKSIISDLSVVLIIASIVGGRTTFVLENLGYYTKYPGEIFKVWEGGLIFYGGLGFAVLFGIVSLKKKRINVPKIMDILAPSVALGLGFARIGCFLNGCCFGKPTNLPWGVVFPSNSPPRWTSDEPIHIHPTQLYESLAGICIFLILLIVENKKKKRPPAYLFCMFLTLYGGWRFSIDFLRYYEPKAYLLLGLTHSQLISILIFLFSIFFIFLLDKSIYLRYSISRIKMEF